MKLKLVIVLLLIPVFAVQAEEYRLNYKKVSAFIKRYTDVNHRGHWLQIYETSNERLHKTDDGLLPFLMSSKYYFQFSATLSDGSTHSHISCRVEVNSSAFSDVQLFTVRDCQHDSLDFNFRVRNQNHLRTYLESVLAES